MSYEVFLDVLFVRNLFMDYLLIRIVNRLMKRKVSVAAGLAGSALASLLVCFWLVLPVGGGAVRFLFRRRQRQFWYRRDADPGAGQNFSAPVCFCGG